MRRPPALALVSLILAACAAPAASSSLAAVVSPEPSPTHQPTAIPHFTQPPPPPPTCENLGFALTPDFHPPAVGSGFGWVWRDGIFAVDGPIFGAFDPEDPIVAGAPGVTVSIVATDPDLAFSSAYPSFYRRGDVVGWDTSQDTPEPVMERRAREQPDGSFTVRLPSNAGRYVAIAGFGWHSPCMRGQSRAIFAVDVE